MKPRVSTSWDSMPVENSSLVADLVEWIARQPRPYAEVMEAWRTSCPRFPVWEEAVDHAFVTRLPRDGRGEMIQVTPAGFAFLRAQGRVAD
jgi:hypothetical protein